MSHDDFAVEPVPGLPETPPEGEHILWQGRPNWWALARESLNINWIMGYFVLLGAWRSLNLSEIVPLPQAIWGAVPFLVLGLLACGILALIAYLQARTTIYTITNRRVAMRIGAALTVTLNLPYAKIGSADLDLRRGGTGTIALELCDNRARLGFLTLWPHARPWRMNPAQPALRRIPEAEKVAEILAGAVRMRSEPRAQAPMAVAAE